MATSSAALNNSTTDATFRALVSFISTALDANFPKTADAGQIDPVTVTKPIAANVSAGFEMRRFNDALQATQPIIFKIEYGSGGNTSGNSFSQWITVGKTAPGAGVVGNIIFARYQMGNIASSAVPADGANSFMSTGSEHFCWTLFNGRAGYTQRFGLERTRDGSGLATVKGALLLALHCGSSNPTSNLLSSVLDYQNITQPLNEYVASLATGAANAVAPCLVPFAPTSGLASDNTVAIYPAYQFGIGRTEFPGRNFASGFATDFTNEVSFAAVMSGQSQQMIALANDRTDLVRGRTINDTNIRTLMRYD